MSLVVIGMIPLTTIASSLASLCIETKTYYCARAKTQRALEIDEPDRASPSY